MSYARLNSSTGCLDVENLDEALAYLKDTLGDLVVINEHEGAIVLKGDSGCELAYEDQDGIFVTKEGEAALAIAQAAGVSQVSYETVQAYLKAPESVPSHGLELDLTTDGMTADMKEKIAAIHGPW